MQGRRQATRVLAPSRRQSAYFHRAIIACRIASRHKHAARKSPARDKAASLRPDGLRLRGRFEPEPVACRTRQTGVYPPGHHLPWRNGDRLCRFVSGACEAPSHGRSAYSYSAGLLPSETLQAVWRDEVLNELARWPFSLDAPFKRSLWLIAIGQSGPWIRAVIPVGGYSRRLGLGQAHLRCAVPGSSRARHDPLGVLPGDTLRTTPTGSTGIAGLHMTWPTYSRFVKNSRRNPSCSARWVST